MEEKKLYDQLAKVWNGLTDEQREKARACKDLNELSVCLGEMGEALPDELMGDVSGGNGLWGAGGHPVTLDIVDTLLNLAEPWNPSYHTCTPFTYNGDFSKTKRLYELTDAHRISEALIRYGYDMSNLEPEVADRLFRNCH